VFQFILFCFCVVFFFIQGSSSLNFWAVKRSLGTSRWRRRQAKQGGVRGGQELVE